MIPEAAIRRLNAAYAGRARDEAYLELAQEHFLAWLQAEGVLDELVFKGGTSLRKFVFGLRGRFSLDLDFTALDRGAGELVIEALAKGFVHEGVSFRGFDIDRGAMKGAWRADAPRLGETALACRLDFSTRRLLLPSVAKQRQPLPGVDEHHLGFALVEARIADLRETCAEKLARLRRVKFARDIYDLDLLAPEVRSGLGWFGSCCYSRCTSTSSMTSAGPLRSVWTPSTRISTRLRWSALTTWERSRGKRRTLL